MRIQIATSGELDASASDYERTRDALVSAAIQDLTETIKLDALHAEAYLCRGCLEANVGPSSSKTRKRAMEDLAMAIALRPDDSYVIARAR